MACGITARLLTCTSRYGKGVAPTLPRGGEASTITGGQHPGPALRLLAGILIHPSERTSGMYL